MRALGVSKVKENRESISASGDFGTSILEVRGLEKRFGSRIAVNGVSFSVREGEIYGLLGPNGAGKSTTLSLVCGLLRPDHGQVVVGGREMVRDAREAKELIGIVPQEPALYPLLSARENLRFWGTINGVPARDLNRRVEESLDLVGLEERANGRVSTFSGGMKRRLNIAAGLVHRPRLLIMDEPTVGIDPQSRNHILETVKSLRHEMTVIYTSHYVDEVEYLCDRVAIMDHGSLIAEGSLSDLLHQGSQYQELTITLERPAEGVESSLSQVPGVVRVSEINGCLSVLTPKAEEVLPTIFQAVSAQGGVVVETRINKPNLESLFLKLTGRALRD